MKREYIAWIAAIAGLLLIGFAIGRVVGTSQPSTDDAFRTWLWEYRSLDLLVQVGLILAGALGVAATLPRHRDDHDKADERITHPESRT